MEKELVFVLGGKFEYDKQAITTTSEEDNVTIGTTVNVLTKELVDKINEIGEDNFFNISVDIMEEDGDKCTLWLNHISKFDKYELIIADKEAVFLCSNKGVFTSKPFNYHDITKVTYEAKLIYQK